MAMGGHMVTPTEYLRLVQWFSPAFPVGAFAYSHGLEAAIQTGSVRSANDVATWVGTVLHHGAGWNDCVLMSCAYRAQDRVELREIDAISRAFCASSERLKESDLQGRAFCKTVEALDGIELGGLTYPVGVGRASALLSLPIGLTAQFYLQGFMSNLVSVAMRLLPLGQTKGQVLISELTQSCIQIADQVGAATLEDMRSSSFLTDIASMHHETQYSRVCRT